MKILLFGAQGQVGFELQRSLAGLGEIIASQRSQVDLENLDKLASYIRKVSPDIIINAAAYTLVDKAQEHELLAEKINALAPEVMAKIAKELDAWFVHYSTDYVFNGEKSEPYIETDSIDPINVYGKTKAQAEQLIQNANGKHLIFRTSWVYAAHGHNFARTILNLASQRGSLNIVGDQIGAPTSAELIADITAFILYRIKTDQQFKDFQGGLYHLTAKGSTSWFGFASYLIMHAQQFGADLKVTLDKITAISSAQYPTPAKRPINSQLNTEKIQQQFNLELPMWQWHADRFLAQYFANKGQTK
ncbi:MAG: dTDP-4-dehydrorhamnose reductase [Gammaproteobacteria bacterium]